MRTMSVSDGLIWGLLCCNISPSLTLMVRMVRRSIVRWNSDVLFGETKAAIRVQALAPSLPPVTSTSAPVINEPSCEASRT